MLLPHKDCDVFQTDLPEHLRPMGITHLVIAGRNANLHGEIDTVEKVMEATEDRCWSGAL